MPWSGCLILRERFTALLRAAFSAVWRLEQGGEQALLAEALITQAIALARLGRCQSALGIFKRAASIAETAGDPGTAGACFLVATEELKEFLSPVARTSLVLMLDRVILYGMLVLLVLTAIPYGTVEPWSEALFECAVFVFCLLWLIVEQFLAKARFCDFVTWSSEQTRGFPEAPVDARV